MNVMVERTSPTTMAVSWRPLTLSEARGFVIFYGIAYTPTSNSRRRQAPQDMMRVNASADSSNVTIMGLDRKLGYSVTVSAITRAGKGPQSRAVMVVARIGKIYTAEIDTYSITTSNTVTTINIGAIVGGTVAVILILILIAIIFAMLVVR